MKILLEISELLHEMNCLSIGVRIFLAVILGGVIGMNRGKHGRAAGTRTHILVCLGAAVTTMLGFYTADVLGFSNDPLRLGAQVISGIGFLGVGTIMIRNHSQVTGLTTAAGLWTTACIGLAIGSGFYVAAILAFAAVILTFTLLSHLERKLVSRDRGAYYIELKSIEKARQFYDEMHERIAVMDLVPPKSGISGHVGMELTVENARDRKEIFAELKEHEDIVIAIPHNQ